MHISLLDVLLVAVAYLYAEKAYEWAKAEYIAIRAAALAEYAKIEKAGEDLSADEAKAYADVVKDLK